MNWGMYGILIIFGVFIILLIINPRLSCFGKALRSPLYPVFRKRKSRQIKTHDYGFNLSKDSGNEEPLQIKVKREIGSEKIKGEMRQIKTEDYGFKLADNKEKQKSEETKQDSKEEEELGSD